jgi:hypothetical protein
VQNPVEGEGPESASGHLRHDVRRVSDALGGESAWSRNIKHLIICARITTVLNLLLPRKIDVVVLDPAAQCDRSLTIPAPTFEGDGVSIDLTFENLERSRNGAARTDCPDQIAPIRSKDCLPPKRCRFTVDPPCARWAAGSRLRIS